MVAPNEPKGARPGDEPSAGRSDPDPRPDGQPQPDGSRAPRPPDPPYSDLAPDPDLAPDLDLPPGGEHPKHLHRLGAAVERDLAPVWRRVSEGEARWVSSLAVALAIGLQITLPGTVAARPRWLLPGIAVALSVALAGPNPRRFTRTSPLLTVASHVLIATMSLANAWSAARLVVHLVNGADQGTPTRLLLTGGSIWLTNVVLFGLWYWELDRGGPVARAHAVRAHPDFLFPQMQSPSLAPARWAPQFVDYAYLSFTNATAFSPTDVMPLTRWAKLTMMLQSMVSLIVVALVVARAVNILR
jgi:hypothetical protein